jgi:hypothetical protein
LKKLRPKTRRRARKSHETVYEADSYCDLDLDFEAYCSVSILSLMARAKAFPLKYSRSEKSFSRDDKPEISCEAGTRRSAQFMDTSLSSCSWLSTTIV